MRALNASPLRQTRFSQPCRRPESPRQPPRRRQHPNVLGCSNSPRRCRTPRTPCVDWPATPTSEGLVRWVHRARRGTGLPVGQPEHRLPGDGAPTSSTHVRASSINCSPCDRNRSRPRPEPTQPASRRRPQPPRRAVAATPGTRQHGLGLSVDLCGGVQDFSAPAHLWMQRHAPLYGWFHPAWAESSGVRPEPWHWEFAS